MQKPVKAENRLKKCISAQIEAFLIGWQLEKVYKWKPYSHNWKISQDSQNGFISDPVIGIRITRCSDFYRPMLVSPYPQILVPLAPRTILLAATLEICEMRLRSR
jgi:hypothetical protein